MKHHYTDFSAHYLRAVVRYPVYQGKRLGEGIISVSKNEMEFFNKCKSWFLSLPESDRIFLKTVFDRQYKDEKTAIETMGGRKQDHYKRLDALEKQYARLTGII